MLNYQKHRTFFAKSLIRFLSALFLLSALFFSLGEHTAHAAESICTACNGIGTTTCYSCAGTGMKTCTACSGTGGTFQNQMTSPGGYNAFTGMFSPPSYSMVKVNCIVCNGSGRQLCLSCSGGRIRCLRCNGTGRVNSGSSTDTSNGSDTGVQNDSSDTTADSKTNGTATGSKVKYGTVLDALDGVGDYEDAPNLLDGKKDTKYNVESTSLYIIWKAPKMLSVSSYVITTGNDNATYTGRNPKTWVLYGSNKKLSRNAKGWKVIHSVKNDKKLQDKNYTKYTFKLAKAAKPYLYYKLEVKENKGADCTQMAEFTLKGKAVTSKATVLSYVKKKDTKLNLKWKKISGVTGYQIQYSTSSKFKGSKTVTVKGAAKASTSIANLKKGKTYYVRIRTYRKVNGGTVYSAWSKKGKAS